MLGIHYFKAEPTEFARIRVGGKVTKEGPGVSGFYLPFRTTIEVVPTGVADQPFSFMESSTEDQEVTFQGGFIYRIADPRVAIARYNFSIDPRTRGYQTEDSTKLPAHVLQLVQGEARKLIQSTKLEELLRMGDTLSERVTAALSGRNLATSCGVEFSSLYFSTIRPKAEIAKALEATYRESLLQKADEATYARRALAVEKERTIQQNEMATRVDLETKRRELVALEGANAIAAAEYRAKAVKQEMDAYAGVPADRLMAQALLLMGQNASKIGTLSITPDFLSAVTSAGKASK